MLLSMQWVYVNVKMSFGSVSFVESSLRHRLKIAV